MVYTIRKATEDDFEKLIDLFQDFATFHKTPEAMENTVERMRNEKDSFRCLVAETDEKEIMGYTVYFDFYQTWKGKAMYIDDIFIREKHRGKGIGKHLINEVISQARSANCHSIRWQVSDWNEKAKAFYLNLGAEIDSTERNVTLSLD